MKTKGIALTLLMLLEFGCYAELTRIKEVVSLANQYSEAIDGYYSTPLGKLEQQSKNALKSAYLNCDGSDEELLYKLGAHTEVMRRIKEWRHKCAKGIMHKTGNDVSVENFVEKAQLYALLHKQVSQSPEYQAHKSSHNEYKQLVLNWLKQGHSPAQINLTLQSYGISNTRVLSRTEYWLKKEL